MDRVTDFNRKAVGSYPTGGTQMKVNLNEDPKLLIEVVDLGNATRGVMDIVQIKLFPLNGYSIFLELSHAQADDLKKQLDKL